MMIIEKCDGCPHSTLENVKCDCCGESCKKTDMGQTTFEYATLTANWGYGSAHDGERHDAQICEKCFFKILEEFKIKTAARFEI